MQVATYSKRVQRDKAGRFAIDLRDWFGVPGELFASRPIPTVGNDWRGAWSRKNFQQLMA